MPVEGGDPLEHLRETELCIIKNPTSLGSGFDCVIGCSLTEWAQEQVEHLARNGAMACRHVCPGKSRQALACSDWGLCLLKQPPLDLHPLEQGEGSHLHSLVLGGKGLVCKHPHD
jgi:hypothetical protein